MPCQGKARASEADRQLCLQLAKEENNPRGINRHKYSVEEAAEALEQPVVQALMDLCKVRNTHPAFNGKVRPPCRPAAAVHHLTWQRSSCALVPAVRRACKPLGKLLSQGMAWRKHSLNRLNNFQIHAERLSNTVGTHVPVLA